MTYALEQHDGRYYIKDANGHRVRIRTNGRDTGVNKSWYKLDVAKKVLERLNSGVVPPTVCVGKP